MYFGTSFSRLPQPTSSSAGPGYAPRSELPPAPPSTEDWLETVPFAEVSQTSPGATFASWMSMLSQSKRALATFVTASRRATVASANVAYGLRSAACCSAWASSLPIATRRSLPELIWLETMTM